MPPHQSILENLDKENRLIRKKEMERLKRDAYSGGMACKYDKEKPSWVLIELLSFGGFISFYLFCAKRWQDQRMKNEHYLLRQVQAVRNACAHSTNIVNGFASGEESDICTPREVAMALEEIGINRRARRSKMTNPRIQQITMMAFAYKEMVTGGHTRQMCRELTGALKRRAVEHAGWYARVDSVTSAYRFLAKVFDRWI